MKNLLIIGFFLLSGICTAQQKVTLKAKPTPKAGTQLIRAQKITGASSKLINVSNDYSGYLNLPVSARVSIGVYTADTTLVRTIESNVYKTAGGYNLSWDGKDDRGQVVANRNTAYHFRAVYNNITATWEGVVGNTSSSFTGTTVHRGWYGIVTMASSGTACYYGKQYSEGSPSHIKFAQNNIQARQVIIPTAKTAQNVACVATDGSNVYWLGADSHAPYTTFVFGTKASDDTEVQFTSGFPLTVYAGYKYQWAFDTLSGLAANPTGLAVQKNGNFLFVARSLVNEIHVLNKTTGAFIRKITIPTPGKLCVDNSDNLWVISGTNTVARYTVASDGTLGNPTLSLSGLVAPMAVSVSPTTGEIVVADGGSRQQLFGYNNSGALLWTYGQEGGYSTNSTATTDKFMFTDIFGYAVTTFICHISDGSFWVGDTGNSRAIHYSAARGYLEEIQFLPKIYSSHVDPNNPTRVFANFLEFEVDYTKTLGGTNGSWKLKRNWGGGVPSTYWTPNTADNSLLKGVATLSNGRTYATLKANSIVEVVELVSGGTVRFTGVVISPSSEGQSSQLYPDGNIYRCIRASIPAAQTWTKRTLLGFDGNNNPVYGAAVTIASTPATTAGDPTYRGNVLKLRSGEITTPTNLILAFDGSKASTWSHLGAVKLGTNKWKWRTAFSTTPTYTGIFPNDGWYDVGNSVNNTGISQQANGRIILWGYHGEFWKGGQTNEYNLVYDNGLMLMNFGTTFYDVALAGLETPPAQMAGNAFSGNLVKVGANLYYYHNDENYHSGVHRWKISGLNTIGEIVIPITSKTPLRSMVLPGNDLHEGLQPNVSLVSGTAGWVRNPTVDSTSSGTKYFVVATSRKSYKVEWPDLYARYNSKVVGKINTIDRSLSSVSQSAWSYTGYINHDGLIYGNNSQGGQYVDVLDNQDKIIQRVYPQSTGFGTGTSAFMAGTSTTLASGPTSTFMPQVLEQQQFLSIACDNAGNVSVSYGNYPTQVVPRYDLTANYHRPTKLRISFFTLVGGNSYDRIIDLDRSRFVGVP
ncbi:hypothetical protein [Spirosoma sp. KNUC1025]|uniref:hypothetical protein n=1 Tax=Spirosoma sp. KNUC1025 TaxID=2894082 RepID=UPI003863E61F|nr:hypothetical protein LN737_19155 [Spirosoma sp. KNUC1025]